MADSGRQNRKKRRTLPLVLLALVCVTVAELVACYFYAPNLYAKIVTPVRDGVYQMAAAGRRTWDHLATAVFAPKVETPAEAGDMLEAQMAGAVNKEPPAPIAEPSTTELIARDGLLYLTGGPHEVNYYNQTDPKWAQVPYGTDPLGEYGCGPTAMSMAVSTLTSTLINPEEMAAWAVEQGYWAKKQGSYLAIVSGTAKSYGLNCTPVPAPDIDPEALRQRLAAGDIAVALMTKGHFTNNGHFILLRGVSLDGRILVADPASPERSLTLWDLDLILSELSARPSNTASLWMLSAPDSF